MRNSAVNMHYRANGFGSKKRKNFTYLYKENPGFVKIQVIFLSFPAVGGHPCGALLHRRCRKRQVQTTGAQRSKHRLGRWVALA